MFSTGMWTFEMYLEGDKRRDWSCLGLVTVTAGAVLARTRKPFWGNWVGKIKCTYLLPPHRYPHPTDILILMKLLQLMNNTPAKKNSGQFLSPRPLGMTFSAAQEIFLSPVEIKFHFRPQCTGKALPTFLANPEECAHYLCLSLEEISRHDNLPEGGM